MHNAGFASTIRGDDGKTYHLPTAEYYYFGSVALTEVRDKAASAAGTTGRAFAVLVTEGERFAWQGLLSA
jgi:hypothetical protein